MSLPLVIGPEAEADIHDAYKSLQDARSGLGERFVSAAVEAFERIEATPQVYGCIWKDVRAVRLKKLRYLVYYVILDDRIEILAVLHGARDPSIWKSRH